LTIEGLAEGLNVGTRQIPRYENGETDPSADGLSRMAKYFRVSPEFLLGESDEPNPNLREEDLSPMERKLIAAVRNGSIVEALKTITSISEFDDQADVARRKKAANG
jgi:transcriptional regulator with XRE-family HTH domain